MSLALSAARVFYLAPMSISKGLAALLLAVIWVTAVFHVELESAGLLPEHTHIADIFHHVHSVASHGAHDHADHEHGFSAHDEVVARSGAGWLGFVLGLSAMVPAAFSLFGLVWLMGVAWRLLTPVVIRPPGADRPWTRGVSSWRFLRRCAADSLAPPTAA
jgi:hypothetical protein